MSRGRRRVTRTSGGKGAGVEHVQLVLSLRGGEVQHGRRRRWRGQGARAKSPLSSMPQIAAPMSLRQGIGRLSWS